ncbi:hypothetical protein POTOM_030313 [Populus tomentosa]|uniref:CRIB domain-containing protein n=1 Tax=Populus tomentosa TaxID=118781 RepID=A0A8X7ZEA7_POPTO|nr:hypothetical protein POTOM_030313 [Populus tomentosa]
MGADGLGTVFTPSLEGMKHVKSDHGEMLTKPFLDVCKLILPVIDKFGAAMTLVKSDIGMRLENKYLSDPSKYNHLYTMIQEEVDAKTAKRSSSCTNCLLWLTRAMDFLVELFLNLLAHPDWTMSQACTDSYGKTLKKFHGWVASSYSTVVMKLVPDRKKFMEVISGPGNVSADMEQFCTTFPPFLEENHKFLASVVFALQRSVWFGSRYCALRKAVLPTLKHREEQQKKPKARAIFPNRFSRVKRQFIVSLLFLIGDKATNQELTSIRVEGRHLVHGTKLCVPGQRLFDVQSLTLQDHGIVLTSSFCFSKDKRKNLRVFFYEKEQEMQIGFPTDVKHVAHIGCDGPSATNAPSWVLLLVTALIEMRNNSLHVQMNEFNSPPELLCVTSNSKEEVKSLPTDPPAEDTIQTEKPRQRSRRSSGSASSLLNSPDRRSSDSSRNSRHQSSSGTGSPLNSPRGTEAPKSYRRRRSSNKSMDSPKGESSGTNRISRRQKNSSLGDESPTHDQPSIPKHSRGRKSKGSAGSGSSKSKEKKSSKEAIPFSDPGSGGCESINGRKNIASQLSSVLEAYEEEG